MKYFYIFLFVILLIWIFPFIIAVFPYVIAVLIVAGIFGLF